MASLQQQLTTLSNQVSAIAEFLLGDGQPTTTPTASTRGRKPTSKVKLGRKPAAKADYSAKRLIHVFG
jgi:hypothetical protein